jgi:hypothetical protein
MFPRKTLQIEGKNPLNSGGKIPVVLGGITAFPGKTHRDSGEKIPAIPGKIPAILGKIPVIEI